MRKCRTWVAVTWQWRWCISAFQQSPYTTVHRISTETDIPWSQIWRLLHSNDLYSFDIQRSVTHFPRRSCQPHTQFCRWLEGQPQLTNHTLFLDEAQFHCDSITNKRHFHSWWHDNPNGIVQSRFQYWLHYIWSSCCIHVTLTHSPPPLKKLKTVHNLFNLKQHLNQINCYMFRPYLAIFRQLFTF
jgi:hypothetical protein